MDSNKIKKGLGRGLSSLIGETKVETKKNKMSVSDLVPNKYQPRKIFDEENLNELANSIRQRGILQPIIVRKDIMVLDFQMQFYVLPFLALQSLFY